MAPQAPQSTTMKDAAPAKPVLELSQKALDLILSYEGFDKGGWPGGDSGCTIGFGYDLGYHTFGQFAEDWRTHLSANDFRKLRALVGVKGTRARDMARVTGTVAITRDAARAVFMAKSVPRAIAATIAAFPGVEKLPPDAAGALISLVFNRGGRMKDNDPQVQERREMRAVRAAVERVDLMDIAVQIRSMRRLWEGKNLGGLIRRREAEAALVESCIDGAPGKPRSK
jgi:GH24 family phage-related lysozyme (muramidase)